MKKSDLGIVNNLEFNEYLMGKLEGKSKNKKFDVNDDH